MRPVVKQIILILGAFLVVVLLFFARSTPSSHSSPETKIDAAGEGRLMALISEAKTTLPKSDQDKLKGWEILLEKKAQPAASSSADSLIQYWSGLKKPLVSAWYAQKKAEKTDRADDWSEAGKRYLISARFAKEEDKPTAYSSAIHCLKYAYSKDSLNLQTQTQLGVSYVEGSSDPMKGIAMLKGVVEKDPENLEANLNLGLFSVKSGQYQKAVERFEKIIKIDPSYIEIYLFLANTYERMGNKEKAIESLEKYRTLVDDNMVKTEVQNYINNLKK